LMKPRQVLRNTKEKDLNLHDYQYTRRERTINGKTR
jgi:hypothetical protein